MRKTVTITIGGALFHIEEDAYRELDQYLHAIRQHFSTYPDHEEIVSDIEGRIAEEFADTLKDKKRAAVSQEDVTELIARMGTVEDFKEFAASEAPAPEGHADGQRTARLYRDGEDVILGGVAAGIARYLGIDPLVIRLVFAFSIFLGGFGVLLYAILWALLPVARTPSEKVEMMQGRVTLSAIEQRVNAAVASEKNRSAVRRALSLPLAFLRRVLEVIGAVLRAVLPVLLRLIGLGIAVAAAAGMAFATFFYFALLLDPGSPYIGFPLREAVGALPYASLLTSAYLAVLLPLTLVLLLGASLLTLRRVVSGLVVAGIAGLWLVAAVTGGVTGFMAGPQLEEAMRRYDETDAQLVTRSYDLSGFTAVEADGIMDAVVRSGTGYSVVFTAAEADLETIPATMDGGTLVLDPRFADDHCLIFCRGREMRAEVTMPSLTAAAANGLARLEVRGFEGDVLALTADGASRLTADVDVRALRVAGYGVSRFMLAGSGSELSAELSGPVRLEAFDFPVRDAILELNGPARAHVDVSDSLTGEVNGPGAIRYRNEPSRVEVEVLGPGSVGRAADEHIERW